MKIFKQDDGIIDIFHKVLATLGVFFGIWAYFHSIHPVFQKELELQGLRSEKEKLIQDADNLKFEIASIYKNKESLENEINLMNTEKISLNEKINSLSAEVKNKEILLQNLKNEFDSASDSAVLHKIQYYSDKIISGYLLHISSGKNGEFDVIGYAKDILSTHNKDFENIYEKQAYEYVFNYVKQHENDKITGDKIAEFAISIPYYYKIENLKKNFTN